MDNDRREIYPYGGFKNEQSKKKSNFKCISFFMILFHGKSKKEKTQEAAEKKIQKERKVIK